MVLGGFRSFHVLVTTLCKGNDALGTENEKNRTRSASGNYTNHA